MSQKSYSSSVFAALNDVAIVVPGRTSILSIERKQNRVPNVRCSLDGFIKLLKS